MLTQLQWSSLEKRRSVSHLYMLYRILHDPDIPVETPIIVLKCNILQEMITPITIIILHASTTHYQQSFSMNDKRMPQLIPS